MFPYTPLPKPKTPIRLKIKKGKKPSSRTMLERKADALVREIVLDRDEYCVCPAPKEKGHSNVLQCGHLITRGKESVKWDLWNCNVQCSSCNMRHRNNWQYYDDWFIREFGQSQRLRLSDDSYVVRKLSQDELETLISELTAIHRRQLDNPKWKPRFSQKEILSGRWRDYDGDTRTSLSPLRGVAEVQSQQIG